MPQTSVDSSLAHERGWWRDETFLHDLNDRYRDRPGHAALIGRRSTLTSTESVSYEDLTVRTAQVRKLLLDRGIRTGDAVAVQIGNRWEMAAFAFATLSIGAVLCPVPPESDIEELLHRLRVVRAILLLTDRRATDTRSIRLGAPTVREALVVGDSSESDAVTVDSLLPAPTDSRRAHEELVDAAAHLYSDAACLMLFTSGTTGPSKAVVHSHNSLYAAVRSYVDNFGLDRTTVVAVTTPVVHYSGLVQGILTTTLVGGTTVIQDSRDAEQFLPLIEATGTTVMYGPPQTLLSLAATQRVLRCDVSSLDRVIVGSAPVVEALTAEIDEVFGARTSSLWGMSEFGPAVLTPGDAPPSLPAISNGNAIAGVEIRIVGQARHAAHHPVGRLEVRGASRALGYFGQQDQFDAAVDSDGWFDTGDVARDLGDDGIRVLGRAADVIWIGENIVPTVEIEASIQLLDGVDEASVIPSLASRGEKTSLCAVLARSDTRTPDTDLSVDAVRARLIADGFPDWCLPSRVEVVDHLPKTSTGKIRKRRLRDEFAITSRTSETVDR
ncbi:AMP-binding protein [Rhodococcus erythropolis]|uniref:AMP-binding protein n=1 Tax=Rhodococcus erythropolis TaxID=1833 RepID=A0AAX4A007_RHOER|nr:AMP-binding protein [Rhodococcus erythropolis]WMN03145.1 AMP-binding protein [Rhodococcus erythropolis]WMN03230.1 AMP-binding protein [Rhodococcus erythropolis]